MADQGLGEGRLMSLPMNEGDGQLRDLLRTLSPAARGQLRVLLIRDQFDRDLIGARLLRYRDVRGAAWANLIDELSLNPELRERCIKLLGELG
jgi:hypothetical protein